MDVMGALVGFVLLAPLFVGIAAFIKATSPGPAFFRQQRVGFQGKLFTIWKFRTMHVDADTRKHQHYVTDLVGSDKALQKLDMKSQMVPLGKWLRRLGLDELPQLINILCGSMSLVGPRPDVVPLDAYSPWQRRRFDVLPGITGLWQVRGKNGTTFRQMVRLDIAYAQRRSLGLESENSVDDGSRHHEADQRRLIGRTNSHRAGFPTCRNNLAHEPRAAHEKGGAVQLVFFGRMFVRHAGRSANIALRGNTWSTTCYELELSV